MLVRLVARRATDRTNRWFVPLSPFSRAPSPSPARPTTPRRRAGAVEVRSRDPRPRRRAQAEPGARIAVQTGAAEPAAPSRRGREVRAEGTPAKAARAAPRMQRPG